jgi:hypothetical protein
VQESGNPETVASWVRPSRQLRPDILKVAAWPGGECRGPYTGECTRVCQCLEDGATAGFSLLRAVTEKV